LSPAGLYLNFEWQMVFEIMSLYRVGKGCCIICQFNKLSQGSDEMNEETFETICHHLEPDQFVKIKTLTGGKIFGKFLRYDHNGLSSSICITTTEGHTLCVPAPQVDRIFPCDEDDFNDTFPPESLQK
jgi:hypothetical protein